MSDFRQLWVSWEKWQGKLWQLSQQQQLVVEVPLVGTLEGSVDTECLLAMRCLRLVTALNAQRAHSLATMRPLAVRAELSVLLVYANAAVTVCVRLILAQLLVVIELFSLFVVEGYQWIKAKTA